MLRLLEIARSHAGLPVRVAALERLVGKQCQAITNQQEEIEALEARVSEFDVRGSEVGRGA